MHQPTQSCWPGPARCQHWTILLMVKKTKNRGFTRATRRMNKLLFNCEQSIFLHSLDHNFLLFSSVAFIWMQFAHLMHNYCLSYWMSTPSVWNSLGLNEYTFSVIWMIKASQVLGSKAFFITELSFLFAVIFY